MSPPIYDTTQSFVVSQPFASHARVEIVQAQLSNGWSISKSRKEIASLPRSTISFQACVPSTLPSPAFVRSRIQQPQASHPHHFSRPWSNHDISPLISSKCFNTAVFASKNLSTQFCVQLSSLLLSLPPEMPPVIHLVQQMSVRLWIASVSSLRQSLTFLALICLSGDG